MVTNYCLFYENIAQKWARASVFRYQVDHHLPSHHK